MMMVQQIKPSNMAPPLMSPPGDVGFMPQGTGNILLCPEKRDAIERWVTAGAPSS